MARRLKLISGLSTLALAGALTVSGCTGEGESAESGEGAKSSALGEGTPGSESEGGESEGSEGANLTTDNVDYLAQLMMIRGHLQAGAALYETGNERAATHMKHPEDEIYAGLEPAIKARGHEGFANELEALARAVENKEPADEVAKNLTKTNTAIAAAAEAGAPSTKDELLAAVKVLRIAGEEFDLGVKDGKVVNIHEYQDAYGFMAVVLETIEGLSAGDAAEASVLATAKEQAVAALAVAPNPTPPENIEASSATIYGAAARIEIAALGL